MHTYIALFRGINVSGQKLIKMAELKKHFENWGFDEVMTYIQSGNVVFKSDQPRDSLSGFIEQKIKQAYGFEVSILVKTPQEISRILQDNPFSADRDREENKMYFTLLCEAASPENIQELSKVDHQPEEFRLAEDVIYFYAANGYGRAKMNNNFFEKKLGVKATTRNLKTMRKLIEMS